MPTGNYNITSTGYVKDARGDIIGFKRTITQIRNGVQTRRKVMTVLDTEATVDGDRRLYEFKDGDTTVSTRTWDVNDDRTD